MSFNRLNYDLCSYEHVLRESTGPGQYYLQTPAVNCGPCHPNNPKYRLQTAGVQVTGEQALIDDSSDLRNIVRPGTNCPSKKYLPNESQKGKVCEGKVNPNYRECDMPTMEDTRISNPACNLRGTGWNRWEWLCLDPQERVLIPFDYNINNRLVVKDNHRACLPKPLDISPSLPNPTNSPIYPKVVKTCGVPTDPPSVQWANSDTVRQY
jgi:hypothetical protein